MARGKPKRERRPQPAPQPSEKERKNDRGAGAPRSGPEERDRAPHSEQEAKRGMGETEGKRQG